MVNICYKYVHSVVTSISKNIQQSPFAPVKADP